jgi:tripartite-type tricarboxylate transporter receptor subunit TctC
VKRRDFLKLGATFAVMPVAARGAVALDYPTRPVQVIVGQAAASSSDITARLISQFLSQHLGQQFVVEVRPGATGNIATELVARATPDGYTLLLVNSQNTINAALFPNLPFDFVRDIAPIAGVFRVPLVMEVPPSFPAQTVPEFIAYAKTNPGKINMASGGAGGPDHLSGELLKMMTSVNMIHVPYCGQSPALTELLGGQVQVVFSSVPAAL